MTRGSGHPLICHPATPAVAVRAIAARVIGVDAHWLTLRWRIEGAGRVIVPPFAGRVRRDGLWQATCFELFARGHGEGGERPAPADYREVNLSPSEAWAVYGFAGYRAAATRPAVAPPPVATWRRPAHGDVAIFDAAVPAPALPAVPFAAGIAAVIAEDPGGGAPPCLSYWALAHRAPRPDFHNAATFILTISRAEAP